MKRVTRRYMRCDRNSGKGEKKMGVLTALPTAVTEVFRKHQQPPLPVGSATWPLFDLALTYITRGNLHHVNLIALVIYEESVWRGSPRVVLIIYIRFSFSHYHHITSFRRAIMPVVPPEKLVKLQQQGDGIRNVSQMIDISQFILIVRS
jgi:hypothetical protein